MAKVEKVEIDKARVERIIEVLSLISIGEFSPERTQIKVESEDDVGMLEETLNVFTTELAQARLQSEESMQKLIASRVELEEKLSTIERQRMAIQDLSTPVI